LLSRIERRPERYLPALPDAALEPLLIRRQQEIQQARELAADLAGQIRREMSPPSGEERIELLTGRDEVAARVRQLQQAASTEILSFDRPPYHSAPSPDDPVEIAGLARGVRVRAVYAHEALDYPGQWDHLGAMTGHGEQARVFSPLPLTLFIFDRHTAILPVRPLDPELTEGSLLVRTSALLDALHMLFELVWERAAPIAVDLSQPIGAGQRSRNVEDDLIPLLAAGLTDETAAHQLGISNRTLQRRVHALMESLDARSRFQAGYQIGLTLNPQRGSE
ncbi:MAG: LuxR family transcriptional regulator, partial [Streptomyces sp.]|nr:LuxR family transcriptional regulator [Streptomyces sp.]